MSNAGNAQTTAKQKAKVKTGNKGEWSELYVLLRLLADGNIYAMDNNMQKDENTCSPILKIIRHESNGNVVEYKLNKKKVVRVLVNGAEIRQLDRAYLKDAADLIYSGIKNNAGSAFDISGTEEILKNLCCSNIKASSHIKTDIEMQVHDIKTGQPSMEKYSIKSMLGNPPTLMNASKSTNFKYSITGLSTLDVDRINSIDTRSKIKDRISEIKKLGQLTFVSVVNETFKNNLLFIDSMMESILGHVLLIYYDEGIVTSSALSTRIDDINPLNYKQTGLYRYKIKKFLCAVALGLMPSLEWNGQDETSGGYIILSKDGNLLVYHLFNRDDFENYLLNNTKLETASSSKHDFGTIYYENGNMYINLNLQVRFFN